MSLDNARFGYPLLMMPLNCGVKLPNLDFTKR
jgi:hypothetical protein